MLIHTTWLQSAWQRGSAALLAPTLAAVVSTVVRAAESDAGRGVAAIDLALRSAAVSHVVIVLMHPPRKEGLGNVVRVAVRLLSVEPNARLSSQLLWALCVHAQMHLLCGACVPALSSGPNAPRNAHHLPAQWFLDAIVVEMDSVDGADLGSTAGRAQTVAGSLAALRLLAEPQAHVLPRSWTCCTNVIATICRAAEQIADLLQRGAERSSGLLVAVTHAPQNGGVVTHAAWWDHALAQCFECLRSWLLAANSNSNADAFAEVDANVAAQGGAAHPRSTATLLQDESITRALLSAIQRGRTVEPSKASHAAALLVGQVVRQWGAYGSTTAHDAPRRSRAFSHLLAPGRIVSLELPLSERSVAGGCEGFDVPDSADGAEVRGLAFRLAVRDRAGSTQWEISPVVRTETLKAVGESAAVDPPLAVDSADADPDAEADAATATSCGEVEVAEENENADESEMEISDDVDRVRDLIRFIATECVVHFFCLALILLFPLISFLFSTPNQTRPRSAARERGRGSGAHGLARVL